MDVPGRFVMMGALAFATAASVGCSSDAAGEVRVDAEPASVAALNVYLSGSAVDVKSVRLTGTRRTAADSKYPCTSSFTDRCANFPDTGAGEIQSISNLCPSVNLASNTTSTDPSPWDFELALYSALDCGGPPLTGGVSPMIVCYATAAFGESGAENKVVGALLAPGPNSTNILCVAKPASPP